LEPLEDDSLVAEPPCGSTAFSKSFMMRSEKVMGVKVMQKEWHGNSSRSRPRAQHYLNLVAGCHDGLRLPISPPSRGDTPLLVVFHAGG